MAFRVFYKAWNSSTNTPETGDEGSHTIAVTVGGADVTGLTPTEAGNGLYFVEPSDVELPPGTEFGVHGSSITANVTIHGSAGVRPSTTLQPDIEYTMTHTGSGDTAPTTFVS